MANQNGHGGARTPSQPAPVSGPGALSKRTDGGPGDKKVQALMAPTGLDYGDHQALINQERVQPLAQQTTPNPPTGNAVAQAASSTPQYSGGAFGGPSTRPNEPVTTGVAIGPGAGPEALNLPQGNPQAQPTGAMTQLLAKYAATDTTGVLGKLYQTASALGV